MRTMTQTVEKAVTSLVLSATPDPTYFGVNPALSAAISITSPGAGTPTGTVNFYDGGDCTTLGTSLGSGTVSGGTATLASGAYTALNAGNHTLVACYGGDTHFKESGDDELHEVKQAVTQTLLSDSPASTQFGVTVTFTATVSVTAGFGSGTPTGNVKFVLGTDCTAAALTGVAPNATNPAALSAGQAVFTINSLAVGTPTVSACYAGTTNFKESADDEAHVVTAATTITSVTVTPSTQQYSDQTVLKAEVTPFQILSEELTGTVTFYVETAAVSCSAPGTAVAVGSDGILAADDGVAEFTYAVSKAASATAYVVTGCFVSTKAEFANSYNTGSLTVTKEDATIYDVTYPEPRQHAARRHRQRHVRLQGAGEDSRPRRLPLAAFRRFDERGQRKDHPHTVRRLADRVCLCRVERLASDTVRSSRSVAPGPISRSRPTS